jgi:hypothetical protein
MPVLDVGIALGDQEVGGIASGRRLYSFGVNMITACGHLSSPENKTGMHGHARLMQTAIKKTALPNADRRDRLYHCVRLVSHVAMWFSAVSNRVFLNSVLLTLPLEGRREPVMGSRGIR